MITYKMINKYIYLTLFVLLSLNGVLMAQNNKIAFHFNELKAPIEIESNKIKVQKFGAFLKLNAYGRINENGNIVPIDLILSLPKFDYETPQKHTYQNAQNHYIDASKDATLTIKIGDDSYSTFYRAKTGEGNNSKSQTTDYKMIVYNNIEGSVPMVSIFIQPGSFISTSISGSDSETKKLTFSNAQQVFEIVNPYPEGLKPAAEAR